MGEQKSSSPIVVDSKGFVRIDGVCLGRLTPDGAGMQVVDRDRHRSQVRGSRYVVVPLKELAKVSQPK